MSTGPMAAWGVLESASIYIASATPGVEPSLREDTVDAGTLTRARRDIETTHDPVEKLLKIAGVVTTLFKDHDHALVVVGETAVAFYTQGEYACTRVDLARGFAEPIPLRLRQRLMGMIDAAGGPRSWEALGCHVHLVGQLENDSAASPFATDTPYGPVSIIPPEQLLVESLLVATYPVPDERAEHRSRMLMTFGLAGRLDIDWDEVNRLAQSTEYNVAGALVRYRSDVERQLPEES